MKTRQYRAVAQQRGNILVVALLAVAILSIVVGNVISYTTRTASLGSRSQAYAETQIVATSLLELLYAQWQAAANQTFSLNPPVGTFSFMSPAQFTNLEENSDIFRLLNPSEDVSYTVTTYQVAAVGTNGTLLTEDDAVPAAQSSAGDSLSTASQVWYQGIVEVHRNGKNPVRVRVGRVLPMSWESLLNLAMAEFIYSPNEERDDLEFGEMSIFPGPQMDIVGRVYAKGDLFFGHSSLNFYDTAGMQGLNEDTVTTSGTATQNYPTERREKKGNAGGDPKYWVADDEGGLSAGNKGDLVEDGVPEKEVFMGDPQEVFSLDDSDPNNDGYRELIERPVGQDNEAIERERFYNKADVRILVDSTQPPYLIDDDGVITGPNPARVQVYTADYSGSSDEDPFPSGETNITPSDSDPSTWPDTYTVVWESLGLSTDPSQVTNPTGGSKIQDDREGGTVDSDQHNVFITDVDVNQLADGLATTVEGYDNGGFNGGVYISDVSAENNYSPSSDPQEQSGTRSSIAAYDAPEFDGDEVEDRGGYGTSSTNYEKAIRLQNGAVFPDSLRQPNNPAGGLTIVSDNGVYLQGDFNTGRKPNESGGFDEPDSNENKNVPDASDALAKNNGRYGNDKYDDYTTTDDYDRRPAMVAGDALLVLSNAWDDANSHKGKSDRESEATTVNAAIMAGNVKSTDSSNWYDGGMENFPRFLEKWTGSSDKYFTYYGSMLLMFRSKFFNGAWSDADYGAPHRRWYYENRYLEGNGYDAGTGRHTGTPPIYPRVSVEVRSGGFIDYTPTDS